MLFRNNLIYYFLYKGKLYGGKDDKTIVQLSDEFVKKNNIWKYVKYQNSLEYKGETINYFIPVNFDYEKNQSVYVSSYNWYVVIKGEDLDECIYKIIKPVYAVIEKEKNSEMIGIVTAIYIVLMLCSLIFNQFYLLWIILTVIYVEFLKEEG